MSLDLVIRPFNESDPDHIGVFTTDPVMFREHLVAEVVLDPGVFGPDTDWVVTSAAGEPISGHPTRGEAIVAAEEFAADDNDRAGESWDADYDGRLDAAIRNGVR